MHKIIFLTGNRVVIVLFSKWHMSSWGLRSLLEGKKYVLSLTEVKNRLSLHFSKKRTLAKVTKIYRQLKSIQVHKRNYKHNREHTCFQETLIRSGVKSIYTKPFGSHKTADFYSVRLKIQPATDSVPLMTKFLPTELFATSFQRY